MKVRRNACSHQAWCIRHMLTLAGLSERAKNKHRFTVSLHAWCFSLPLPLKPLRQFGIYLKRIRDPIYILPPCNLMRCHEKAHFARFFDPFIPLQFHFTPSSCLLLPLLNLPSHLWLYLKQTCHMYNIITMPSHEVPWGIFILHVSPARSDIQYFHFRFGDACCYPWNSLSTVSLTQLHLPSCHPIFVLLPCHHITWKNEYLFLRSVLTSIWVSFPSLLTFFSTPRVKNWTSVSVIRKL